ncbi:MAG: hypothetical protein ACPG49_07820 [Chitinophagales bacterium]
MKNESHIKGNANIVIQNVTDSTITLNIDGEIQEVRNQLVELKALLQSLKIQKIQYAEKMYNIEHINEANFGFWIGKKVFNEHLTKTLVLAIQPHCSPAQRFLQKVKNRPDWESEQRISNKAKEILAYSFVGVIGIQFGKLMAIGKESFSETKQRKYIKKCLYIVKQTLNLVNFVLLSHLWDKQKTNPIPSISNSQKQVLSQRFDNAFESSIEEQFQLLKTLHTLFTQNNLHFPIEELSSFSSYLQIKSDFYEVCQSLQQLNRQLDKAQYNLLDCFKAETLLTSFFGFFPFLVEYRMASIKRIAYRQIRHDEPHYLHRYTALGIDSKANVDAEKVIYTPKTIYTDAVLFYKGENYWNSTNLFPFVIDYNALTFEYGAKICFYHAQSMDGDRDCLEYNFLEDNSILHIESTGVLKPDMDYNEWMVNEEKRQQLNLDCVVVGFQKARKTVLDELDFEET